MILTDTGPLVALVDKRDADHDRCMAAISTMPDEPLITSWPCLTEAMYFAHRAGGANGTRILWHMHLAGDLLLHDLSDISVARMQQLMERYQDLPMDFADASLIAAAEHLGLRQAFTLDSDFRIYRLIDGSALEVIP